MTNKHSIFSPSGAVRWANCPGSISAEYGLPEVISPYAVKGTEIHMVASDALAVSLQAQFGDDLHIHYDNSDVYPVDDWEEYRDQVLEYIRYVTDIVRDSGAKNVYIEDSVEYDHLCPSSKIDCFGTSDLIIDGGDTLYIIDLKTGYRPVTAKDNYQLIIYALAAIETYGFTPKKIYLGIAQASIGHFDSHEFSADLLEEWSKKFSDAMSAALELDAPRKPSTIACQYCRAFSTCSAVNSLAKRTALKHIKKDPAKMSDDDIKDILDNAPLVNKFMDAVKDQTVKRIEAGIDLPGYYLKPGRNIKRLKGGVESGLKDKYGDSIYKKQLLPMSRLTNILDSEDVESFIFSELSRPTIKKNKEVDI